MFVEITMAARTAEISVKQRAEAAPVHGLSRQHNSKTITAANYKFYSNQTRSGRKRWNT